MSKTQPQQPRSENSATYAPAMSDRESGASSEPGEQGKSKLLDRLRGMSEQINWDYAVVERLNTDRLTTELLPFNLGRAVLQRDASQNLLLQPGDVVTILGRNELALPQERQTRLVRVEGEVAAPGIYQAMPGETMGQLLRRIGGLTPQAYVYGTEFSRESIRKRQQSNLEVLIRRLEAQAQSNGQNLGSNSAGKADAAQVQFAVAQQQAQLKSQIERLRALKSNGRMSLELETRALALADLPELALEDGDQISVPPVPSYVAAFGAVNNENVFIFKPGKTVADIVKSAGLADDADADQLFLLRADGSVLSRGDNNSLFGRPFASISVLPGDTLVVPTKLDRETGYNATVRGLKDWTQILSNLGLGLAAIKTLKN
jgi:protein involved in polysaccharide export with SLBB domain